MYKQKGKSPIPSSLTHQRSSSPLIPRSQAHPQLVTHSSAIDLHQFNDYLQERIARSAKRKEQQMLKRQPSSKKNLHQVPSVNITPTKQSLKGCNFDNLRESNIKKSRQIPSGKPTWKKHDSIQNYLNKENQILFDQNRKTQCENQQALRDLQRKYQQLQEKYKLLMKEATENARAFEKDKKELTKLKQLHSEDEQVLAGLRKQLSSLQKNMKFEGRSQNNEKSVLKIKSESNIPLAQSKSYSSKKLWESKNYEDVNKIETPIKNNRFKTSQNWTQNIDKKALFQSQQKSKHQYPRYYSCQKQPQSARRQTKTRKGSDLLQTKTFAKWNESMKGSRVSKQKPVTQTCIRFDNDFSKSTTPTTLQKKVNSKHYSKYRFQPSYNLQ